MLPGAVVHKRPEECENQQEEKDVQCSRQTSEQITRVPGQVHSGLRFTIDQKPL